MIVAAALCPHPPLLFRELVVPGGDELPETVAALMAACNQAVAGLLAHQPDIVAVVGGGSRTRKFNSGNSLLAHSFAGGMHTAGQDDTGLPLSLGVGSRLLDEAGWTGRRLLQSLRHHLPADQYARIGHEVVAGHERVALLAMGDGSARRGPKAPGYFDHRAKDFDARVVEALKTSSFTALLDLDADLGTELMAQGRPAWQALAGALKQGSVPKVEGNLLYSHDPFGVLYTVMRWKIGYKYVTGQLNVQIDGGTGA